MKGVGDGLTATSGNEMDVDGLSRETCIGCDKGGKMLVCSASNCPVAVHQKCFLSKPRLDDRGNFFCPYCWYKHDVTRALEMKKKLMLTKKALSDFMDVEVGVNSDQQKPNDEGNDMAVDGRSVKNGAGLEVKEIPNEVHTLESHEFENFFDGNRSEEGALLRKDYSQCINKERAVGVPPSASTEGAFMSPKCIGNQGSRSEEEREHLEEEAGTKAPAHDSELSEASNSDTVTHLVRRTCAKRMKTGYKVDLSKKSSPQPHKTSEKDAGIQKNKEISPKRTGNAAEPSKQMDLVTFWNEKRKRLFWTAEEENMLKEGVQKYSTLVKKNLPWRKILVFGGHVFHSTRTPSDLKDKWKNMMNDKARTGRCHE